MLASYYYFHHPAGVDYAYRMRGAKWPNLYRLHMMYPGLLLQYSHIAIWDDDLAHITPQGECHVLALLHVITRHAVGRGVLSQAKVLGLCIVGAHKWHRSLVGARVALCVKPSRSRIAARRGATVPLDGRA